MAVDFFLILHFVTCTRKILQYKTQLGIYQLDMCLRVCYKKGPGCIFSKSLKILISSLHTNSVGGVDVLGCELNIHLLISSILTYVYVYSIWSFYLVLTFYNSVGSPRMIW